MDSREQEAGLLWGRVYDDIFGGWGKRQEFTQRTLRKSTEVTEEEKREAPASEGGRYKGWAQD